MSWSNDAELRARLDRLEHRMTEITDRLDAIHADLKSATDQFREKP